MTLAGYLLFYFARPMHVKVNVANMKTTGSVMKNIYTIGIPATLNLALPSIQVSALNAILAPFPEVIFWCSEFIINCRHLFI